MAAETGAGEASAAVRLDETISELLDTGIRRVHVVAWRDLDDVDAGGSEVHADEFMSRWASRGIDIVHRTSSAIGEPRRAVRNGYRIDRAGGRYSVFGRTAVEEVMGRLGPSDAFVEIWNGVPWFSPLWYRKPRIVVLHHIHGPMWDQIFPRPAAALGRALETRIAPPFYRSALTVTPSEATRQELLRIGFRGDRVRSVPNGTDARFRPGAAKTAHPSLIAVGRLAPVKRFDRLIEAAAAARRRHPELTLTIVGDGPLRDELQSLIRRLDAADWVQLTGRIGDAELVAEYQRAWLTVSASIAEGWGLSLTEGAASGTPPVATDIAGHRSSVADGVTGELVPLDQLGDRIADVLGDRGRLERLRAAGILATRQNSWDDSALGVANALRDESRERRRHR